MRSRLVRVPKSVYDELVRRKDDGEINHFSEGLIKMNESEKILMGILRKSKNENRRII